jgi:predicted GIY-YIG superfamily endonuclease
MRTVEGSSAAKRHRLSAGQPRRGEAEGRINPTLGALYRAFTVFHVYVIQNPDGKLYIGQTGRLQWRLSQHKDPDHTLTRRTKRFRGPWTLVHSEELPTRSAALTREKALKSGQGRACLKTKLGC